MATTGRGRRRVAAHTASLSSAIRATARPSAEALQSATFPALLPVDDIRSRLDVIFPQGSSRRANCTTDASARTIAAMLYAGAIEGSDLWVRPQQVYTMSDAQYALDSRGARQAWWSDSLTPRYAAANQWYAANTRESVRDDTIRNGLSPNGAVVERAGISTTSSIGRYALGADFAALFDPSLTRTKLESRADQWRHTHLTGRAIARVAIVRRHANSGHAGVTINYPNGRAEVLSPGPSSILTKSVVEEFSRRFLLSPSVVWVSESANKVIDPTLASPLGLSIDASENLPDVILVDSHDEQGDFLLVFVEVVHTDGPITEVRKELHTSLAQRGGFDPSDLAFVTAFADRDSSVYRRLASQLAWGSFVWFASEPDELVFLREGRPIALTRLVRL